MPFREIKLSKKLMDIIDGLPNDIIKELQKLVKDHIFPGRVIPEKDLKKGSDYYTLNRDWNGYDDFWNQIIFRKEKEVNLDTIINDLNNSIKNMRNLKNILKKMK